MVNSIDNCQFFLEKWMLPFNFLRKSQILWKGNPIPPLNDSQKKSTAQFFFIIKRKMIVTIMKPVAEFEHLNVSHHCWFSGFPTFFVRTTIWISSFLWQSPKKGQNWIHTLRKHNIVQHFYYTVFRKSHVVWLSSESELFAKNWNNCTKLQVNFAQKQ